MPAYHQMGNDSENLLWEEHLGRYRGAVLSPVNYDSAGIKVQIERARGLPSFETIFDPQLYLPQSERGCLPEWDYFPKDVDTADPSSEPWWDGLVDQTAKTVLALMPSAVCSPAVVPKTFPNEYYSQSVHIGTRLEAALKGSNIGGIQTVVAYLPDLATAGRALAIASILSRSPLQRFFLVLVDNTEPRRELADPEELKGAMRLIAALEEGGQQVIVGFCSSEMVLWKAAGATVCATGKFFNLRRFTLSRFAEPGGGGGQLSYWFEESLLSFLRESDLLRIQQRDFLSASSKANPFGQRILETIPTKKPWVALGWRQFMHWFADAEYRLDTDVESADDLVNQADENWAAIEKMKPPLFMEERQNDGSWVRQWRRVLAEFPYFE